MTAESRDPFVSHKDVVDTGDGGDKEESIRLVEARGLIGYSWTLCACESALMLVVEESKRRWRRSGKA